MALNRYYLPQPQTLNPLQFLGGFLERRQQVASEEAGLQAAQTRQNQELYAQGLGSLFDPLVQLGMQREQEAGAMGRQQAAIAGQRSLEQYRQQGDIYQDTMQAYRTQYGAAPPDLGPMPPQGGGGGMVEPPPPSVGPTMPEWGTGPPPAPPEAGMPTPAIDPANVSNYRKAADRLAQLELWKTGIDTNPNLSPEHRAAQLAELAPAVATARAATQRYPQPKPPVTWPEMVAAGANNGGVTVAEDGTMFYDKSRFGTSKPDKQAGAQKTVPVYFNGGDPIQVEAPGMKRIKTPDGFSGWAIVGPDGKPTLLPDREPTEEAEKRKFVYGRVGDKDEEGGPVHPERALTEARYIETELEKDEENRKFSAADTVEEFSAVLYPDELMQIRQSLPPSGPLNDQQRNDAARLGDRVASMLEKHRRGEVVIQPDVLRALEAEARILREWLRPEPVPLGAP